jgi:predicted DNA-binding transcriptional regulator YafY
MQARGRVTAAELAGELEVSLATARRDLEALSAAGIPVYPQPGRGGGWSLVGGARTDLSGLSAAESRALFLLAGPAAAGSVETKAALRKLLWALPQTFRADAEAAAGATVLCSTRWGERARRRPEMVDLLQPPSSAGGKCASPTPAAPETGPNDWSTLGAWSTRTTAGT